MVKDRQVLISLADGREVLCWLWASGGVEVSTRDHVSDTWRPVVLAGAAAKVIELDTVDGA